MPEADMGRMPAPYLLADKNEPGKHWYFYKQNGVNCFYSRDLKTWHDRDTLITLG